VLFDFVFLSQVVLLHLMILKSLQYLSSVRLIEMNTLFDDVVTIFDDVVTIFMFRCTVNVQFWVEMLQ